MAATVCTQDKGRGWRASGRSAGNRACGGSGGADSSRQRGHSMPLAPCFTGPSSAWTTILTPPAFEQTTSMALRWTSGDATATPSQTANHANTHQRVGHEAGDAVNFTPRGQAQHAHVAGMATAPQAVVGVQFAGLEVHVGASSCMARCGGGRRCRRGRSAGLFGAGCNASRQANQCSGVDETAPAQAAGCKLLVFLIDHGLPL